MTDKTYYVVLTWGPGQGEVILTEQTLPAQGRVILYLNPSYAIVGLLTNEEGPTVVFQGRTLPLVYKHGQWLAVASESTANDGYLFGAPFGGAAHLSLRREKKPLPSRWVADPAESEALELLEEANQAKPDTPDGYVCEYSGFIEWAPTPEEAMYKLIIGMMKRVIVDKRHDAWIEKEFQRLGGVFLNAPPQATRGSAEERAIAEKDLLLSEATSLERMLEQVSGEECPIDHASLLARLAAVKDRLANLPEKEEG